MFDEEKAGSRKDRSKKGEIDMQIKPLVDRINSLADYYTTSSCAGRIVLLEKNNPKKGSKWLISSHDYLDAIDASEIKIGRAPIWFLMESPILHVCARDIESGNSIIGLAKESGIKRAGFLSVVKRVIIEIFSKERIETLIAKDGKLLVGQDYLEALLAEANIKLKVARSRFEHFGKLIQKI